MRQAVSCLGRVPHQGTSSFPLLPLIGIGISAKSSDVRVAQQLGMLACLPTVAVTSLIAFNVIHATLGLAFGLAAALLLANRLGWRITSAMFDRERLITSTK
jgi:hypothetical protein